MGLAGCVADERGGGWRVDVNNGSIWRQVNITRAAVYNGSVGHGYGCGSKEWDGWNRRGGTTTRSRRKNTVGDICRITFII